MKTINLDNGIIINADMFIIPNSAARIHDLFECVQDDHLKRMQQICELNGMSFDEQTDYMLETWYLSDEYGSENIPDHSIYCNTEDGKHCIIGVDGRYLPAKLFEGKKEGDVVSVKLPVWVRTSRVPNSDQSMDVIADFNITLAQQKYRYARFGTFEDVMMKVIAANRG